MRTSLYPFHHPVNMARVNPVDTWRFQTDTLPCVLESLPDNVDPDRLRNWDDQACREAEYACEEYARTWNEAAYHEGDTIRKRMGLPANQPTEDEILLSQLSWESAKRIDDAWVDMDRVDIRNLKRMLEDSRNTQRRVVASTATGRRVPDLNAG